jgi:NAD(P)-dependent dehydrogenase (short-subunit alcohol dehydrogenase family)
LILITTGFQGKTGLPQQETDGFTASAKNRTTTVSRVGSVEEIANAAVFLASDESSYMTAAEPSRIRFGSELAGLISSLIQDFFERFFGSRGIA